jgi:hypothetical protein
MIAYGSGSNGKVVLMDTIIANLVFTRLIIYDRKH